MDDFYDGVLQSSPPNGNWATTLTQAQAQGQGQLIAAAQNLGAELFNSSAYSSTDDQFITDLYEGYLQRNPDSGGHAFWLGILNGGETRANIRQAFATSAEFQQNVASLCTTTFNASANLKYVLTDVQGTTRAVVDNNGSSSVIVARHDYLSFGEEIWAGVGLRSTSQKYNATDALRQSYALTERDDATGLDHTWFRKLESFSGRWTSPDPYSGSMSTANPQSFNLYSYVQSDPVNFVDPSGLMTICFYEDLGEGRVWLYECMGGGGAFTGFEPKTGGGGAGGGSHETGHVPQNPTPTPTPTATCGVNPATGTPGFTRNPMGQPGHMRPSIRGDGWFLANRGGRPRHSGIDISGVLNVTPVVAFLPGTITFAGHTPGQGGTLVNIDHGNGLTSSYVHLQIGSIPSGLVPTRANPAPQVAQGQRIGTLGDSGNARGTPPHVHFWIRRHGVLQNPETFLNQPCPP